VATVLGEDLRNINVGLGVHVGPCGSTMHIQVGSDMLRHLNDKMNEHGAFFLGGILRVPHEDRTSIMGFLPIPDASRRELSVSSFWDSYGRTSS